MFSGGEILKADVVDFWGYSIGLFSLRLRSMQSRLILLPTAGCLSSKP
jgi:hypothetical protein